MRMALLTLALVGCASAKVDGNNNPPDAGPDDAQDAPPDRGDPPDVPDPIRVTLFQNQDTNIVASTIACRQTNPATNFTRANSYFRVFPLDDFGVTTPMAVSEIAFAVEQSLPGNGGASQPAQVQIGTFRGTIDAPKFVEEVDLVPAATANIQIPKDATNVQVTIDKFNPPAVTFQPGSIVFLKVAIPDGLAGQNIFFIGSNAGAETHPSYIKAPQCQANNVAISDPTVYAQVTATPIRLIMSISGSR